MKYVDGFVIPLPKKQLPAYTRMAKTASKVWRDHGALEYYECVGDDMAVKGVARFPKSIKAKAGETVVFAWIVYNSRAHRDAVNAKVFKDPRIARMIASKVMPFDMKRMIYGGFKVLVEA